MIIGVDLDGVVFDTERIYMNLAYKYNKDVFNNKPVLDINEIRVQKHFLWTNEESAEFLQKYTLDVCKNAPVIKDALSVINTLLHRGHTVLFITARGSNVLEEREITKLRLKELGLQNIPLIFTSQSKLEACKENRVEVLIEDYYNTVLEVAKNDIKCIYFNALSGYHFNKSNVYETNNWKDVLNYFK